MPFKSYFFLRVIFLFGATFAPVLLSLGQTVSYSTEALEYLKLSEQQLEQEEFRKAIATLNQAMGILKETSRNHPLRIQVEKQLRIAKGRSIVAKYSRSHLSPAPAPTGLRPLEEEPKDFSVSQIFGRVISKNIWVERSELTNKDPVGLSRRLTVLPKGGIELYSNREELMFRSLDASSFDINGPHTMSLHSGSYVFHCSKENGSIKLKSPLSECEFKSNSPFVFMAGVTTNGGLKIIALLGKITCVMASETETLIPGQLCFALPAGFSRTMSVELSTLIVTSKLITSFPRPPSFMKKLNQQAMLQALRTRQRYRTVVGDVKGNSDFEIKVIDE